MLFKFNAKDIEIVLANGNGDEFAVFKAADYSLECNVNKLQAAIGELVAKAMETGMETTHDT